MNSPRQSPDDLLLAFDMAPVGLLVARQRVVQLHNQAFCEMFGYAADALAGQSLGSLYPSDKEFRHIGERALVAMRDTGIYSDERIMRRMDGSLFWCHVSGRTTDRHDPFALSVWVFEDLSAARRVISDLTAREREIAQFLVTGQTSKQIARSLGVSPRTIEAHRARLMRKFDVATSTELIARLIGGR
jgi:PAS domain S-box-containing protein